MQNILRSIIIKILISLILALIFVSGCCYKKTQTKKDALPLETVGDIAVLGFKPSLSKKVESGIIKNPLSGALVMAEPVPQDIAERMTDYLFTRIPREGSYHLFSPSQTKGVFSSVISSGKDQEDIVIYQEIGRALFADTVLTGYIYRWREREGSYYSVSSSASVSFDLYLIRTNDRAILWRGQFDKTQKSLSENILDMGTFLKGKMKWMTADELAILGLGDMLNDLFSSIDTE